MARVTESELSDLTVQVNSKLAHMKRPYRVSVQARNGYYGVDPVAPADKYKSMGDALFIGSRAECKIFMHGMLRV